MAERRSTARAVRPVKRSFTIAGHRTSVSLEEAFWAALKEAAAAEQRSVASLVEHIDGGRGEAGLSSAIRVWVLNYVRSHRAPTRGDAH